jgi:DNA-directed RNA polymerase specialized sigma24 family protein
MAALRAIRLRSIACDVDPHLSVTNWLSMVRAGNPHGAQQLWERYFGEMVGLARARLAGKPVGRACEEDVALSAFASFCRRAEEGRFPDLADRDDLWRLLVTVTARKASHLVRDQQRHKRGGQFQRHETDLDYLVGESPSPEFAAQCADEFRQLLDRLQDEQLVRLALWKLEGFTNDEIVAKCGCAPRTVERKLQLIRKIWERSDHE